MNILCAGSYETIPGGRAGRPVASRLARRLALPVDFEFATRANVAKARCSSSLQNAADQALEILGLQAARRDRVVRCLAALVQYLDRTRRLLCHGSDQVGEQLASDQPRARTRDQDAIGLEHIDGGHVETQITFKGMLDVLGLLGILGRVADNHVESLPVRSFKRRPSTSSASPVWKSAVSIRFKAACWRAWSIAVAELSIPRTLTAPALAALSENAPE